MWHHVRAGARGPLVREVTDRPGALPLLQYTLTELFEHRRSVRVDYATYEALGGVSGTLVSAEGLLTSLGDEAHEMARQVFLRLVTFNEGGEETRRRVLRSELEDLDVDRLMLHSVLDTFGRHRLLSFVRNTITRSPTVEIRTRRCSPSGLGFAAGSIGPDTTSAFSGVSRKRSANGTPRTARAVPIARRSPRRRCTAGSPPPRFSCPPPKGLPRGQRHRTRQRGGRGSRS